MYKHWKSALTVISALLLQGPAFAQLSSVGGASAASMGVAPASSMATPTGASASMQSLGASVTGADLSGTSWGKVDGLATTLEASGIRAARQSGAANDPSAVGGMDKDQAEVQSVRRGKKEQDLNQFQRFVQASTGQVLPMYGSDFFVNSPGFSPSTNVPVPGDYRINVGDNVVIRMWGAVEGNYSLSVDREGMITVPRVGQIPVVGVSVVQLESVLRSTFDRYFKGYELSATLGTLRGITVYVVGYAASPGSYQLSSLSTAISALFRIGGVSPSGSLRHVQVKRAGKIVADLDLYAFIDKGDQSSDVRLLDGDVIVIPAAGPYVALRGMLEKPAIYELKGANETLNELLALVGKVPVLANPHKALIERIDSKEAKPRTVAEVALSATGPGYTLKDGDVVTVLPVKAEFQNAVFLRGVLDAPMRVPFKQGMRISDLIPSKDFLVSNKVVSRIADQTATKLVGRGYDEINWEYALVERKDPKELKEVLLHFSLRNALDNPDSKDNLVLMPGDTVTLFTTTEVRLPLSKRQVFVSIEGEVARPGIYQVQAGENLVSVLERAGGVTQDAYLFGTELSREAVRAVQRANMERYLRQLESQANTDVARMAANLSPTDAAGAAKLTAFSEAQRKFIDQLKKVTPNGRVALNVAPKDSAISQLPNLRLEDGDRVVVPHMPGFVQVAGAVSGEASLIWEPGRTVSDYVSIAGASREAEASDAFVMRLNGTVVSSKKSWLGGGVQGIEVLPGDVIVVPEKADKESFWSAFMKNAKDVTQIIYNLGLGAAAVSSLNK